MPLKHLNDMVWYIIIGLLTVLVIAALAVYGSEHDMPSKQWAWFVWFTLLLFVFLGKFYWQVRKPKKFWGVLLGVLVAHVLAYAPLLQYIQRAVWYLVIMPIEGMVIILAFKLTLNIMPDPRVRL
jgi:hypothetical protein